MSFYNKHNQIISETKNSNTKHISYDKANNIISANIAYDTNTKLQYNTSNQKSGDSIPIK